MGPASPGLGRRPSRSPPCTSCSTRTTADLAAQEYRTWLGLVVWDGGWYGGHHVPGYSLLFPPLAALLGAGSTARWPRWRRPSSSSAWRARTPGRARPAWPRCGSRVGLVATLVSGRLTFVLGVATGLAAILAATRGRRWAAPALAVVTALREPGRRRLPRPGRRGLVAGRAAGRPDPARAGERRAAALLAVAALAPVLALGVLFPEGGAFPFAATSFWPALAVAVGLALALGPRERVLRTGAVLYALALVASFVLRTPMGGNVVRLGALIAGPVAALALWDHRRRLLALAAVPLLWFGVAAAADDWYRASRDPSVHASFYRPLLAELARGSRPPRGASRSRSPTTTGRRAGWRRSSRWRAAGSASSTSPATACSTTGGR